MIVRLRRRAGTVAWSVPTGRRLSMLVLALALVGAPALVLRVLCVGSACDSGEALAGTAVPFCGLPLELRREIASGFRERRSPDVMAATAALNLVSTGLPTNVRVPWPGAVGTGDTAGVPDTRVPMAFFGDGIDPGTIPNGTALDSIAPTLEAMTGLRREHLDVRTGEAIAGLAAAKGNEIPLVVVIAWKGVGTPDLERDPGAWPFLRSTFRTGAGSLEAVTGSVPLDPSATLTTLGTGALPSSHGITGTLLREDDGDVSQAWSTQDAGSVVSTFADDLDHVTSERARIAAILTSPSDRGIIGNGWYLDASNDDRVAWAGDGPRHLALRARRMVTSEDLGADEVTDVLGVVLGGRIARVDAATADVVVAIRRLVPDATFVVAGTGSTRDPGPIDAADLGSGVDASIGADVVRGVAADGLFLDRAVLIERSITSERVADTLRRERSFDGEPVFADVYPSFAVAFSRYC